MMKVARLPASGKPHDAAHSLGCAPAPSFWGLLPSRLGDLPASVRRQLGPALDRGAVCFVIDAVDGTTLVTRGGRS